MVNLDSSESYQQPGVARMLSYLHEFPEQARLAWERAILFDLPKSYIGVKKVVVLGMGASAIGGEMARSLALTEGRVPVLVHQDYGLPSFVDEDTLLIASSYSGNTEETVSAFTAAIRSPARKIAITTGGRLGGLARQAGIPSFIIEAEALPRAGFPHSFLPLLSILQKVNALADQSTAVQETLTLLPRVQYDYRENTSLASNPVKQLAVRLPDHMIAVYGGGILAPVAHRWKTQLNENSKTWAVSEQFPELSHNAVVGYESSPSLRETLFVVLLHSDLLHPRVQLHYKANSELLERAGIKHTVVQATGKTPLAQMMNLVLFGDYLSLYLAVLGGVDPCQVDAIEYVKEYLTRFPFPKS